MKLKCILVGGLLTICGCHSATPEGAVLFDESFEIGENFSTTHEQTIKLGQQRPSRLGIELRAVEDGQAVRFRRIRAVVLASGEWELSHQNTGNVVNSGTHERPVESISLLVGRRRVSLTGKHARQHMLIVSADGQIEIAQPD